MHLFRGLGTCLWWYEIWIARLKKFKWLISTLSVLMEDISQQSYDSSVKSLSEKV